MKKVNAKIRIELKRGKLRTSLEGNSVTICKALAMTLWETMDANRKPGASDEELLEEAREALAECARMSRKK